MSLGSVGQRGRWRWRGGGGGGLEGGEQDTAGPVGLAPWPCCLLWVLAHSWSCQGAGGRMPPGMSVLSRGLFGGAMSWPCPPLHAELPRPPGAGSRRPARCQAHACGGHSQVGAGCQARFPPCTVVRGGTTLPVALAGGLCRWWGQLGVGQKGWVHRQRLNLPTWGHPARPLANGVSASGPP